MYVSTVMIEHEIDCRSRIHTGVEYGFETEARFAVNNNCSIIVRSNRQSRCGTNSKC